MMRIFVLCLGLLWLPAGYASGDAMAGKRAFAKCASCHSVSATGRSSFGPQLRGIVGRPAAAADDFKYSPAMRAAGFTWTEARLRAFLHSPSATVPGNKMRFFGISNEREIDDLLAYLRGV